MGASFEDLEVWKAACRLAVAVIKEMSACTLFGLRDQMIGSAVSIASNVAEGSERRTPKDFRHFVHIALGSAAELRTQAYIARETAIITRQTADHWISELKAISRMLQALADSLPGAQSNRSPSSKPRTLQT